MRLGVTMLWIASAVADLAAQTPDSLRIGDRIRVDAPAARLKRAEGVYGGVVGQAIFLDTLQVPVDQITHLRVRHGKRSAAGVGALSGLGLGFFLGLGAGLALGEACDPDSGAICPDEGATALGTALGGALLGTAVGALVGAALKVDRWVEFPLSKVVGVDLRPASGSGGVLFSVRLRR